MCESEVKKTVGETVLDQMEARGIPSSIKEVRDIVAEALILTNSYSVGEGKVLATGIVTSVLKKILQD